MPDALGPAASQTLDPPAGNPNAQGLAHRNPPPSPNACGELTPAGGSFSSGPQLQRLMVDLSGPWKLAPFLETEPCRKSEEQHPEPGAASATLEALKGTCP